MPKVLSTIREELLYSTVVDDGKGRVRKRIDEDNRKVAVIWSVVEIAFWVLCLALSINDELFERCRPLYVTAVVLSLVTLVLAAFVAPKAPRLVRPLVIAMQLILLGAGIGLAFFQWDVRSATFIAAVCTNTSGTITRSREGTGGVVRTTSPPIRPIRLWALRGNAMRYPFEVCYCF